MTRTRSIMRFVEGKGHVIEEVPVDDPQAPGTKQVAGLPGPPPRSVILALGSVSIEELAKEAGTRGLMLVDTTDYQAMLARLSELEQNRDARAVDPTVAPAPKKGGKKPGKGTEPAKDADTLAALIEESATLEELTDLMQEETDPALLAQAEARAGAIVAGEKGGAA
jgi:hypothetical protein